MSAEHTVLRNDVGEWFCLECADAHLNEIVTSRLKGKSLGGALLPTGVMDPRRKTPSYRDVFPNRAARRRRRRSNG